jgi:hypothetical protein
MSDFEDWFYFMDLFVVKILTGEGVCILQHSTRFFSKQIHMREDLQKWARSAQIKLLQANYCPFFRRGRTVG